MNPLRLSGIMPGFKLPGRAPGMKLAGLASAFLLAGLAGPASALSLQFCAAGAPCEAVCACPADTWSCELDATSSCCVGNDACLKPGEKAAGVYTGTIDGPTTPPLAHLVSFSPTRGATAVIEVLRGGKLAGRSVVALARSQNRSVDLDALGAAVGDSVRVMVSPTDPGEGPATLVFQVAQARESASAEERSQVLIALGMPMRAVELRSQTDEGSPRDNGMPIVPH